MSSSAKLANRNMFKKYFQLLVNDKVHALGFVSIVLRYGWRQLVVLQQNENLFTAVRILLFSDSNFGSDGIIVSTLMFSVGLHLACDTSPLVD